MRSLVKYIVGIILLALYCAASFICYLIKNENVINILGLISLVIIFIIIDVNTILLIKNKNKKVNIEELLIKFERSKKLANNSKAYRKKILRIISFGYLYSFILLLSLFFLGSTIVYYSNNSIPLILIFSALEMFITLGLISFIPKQKFKKILDEVEYPFINELVNKCKQKLNVDKKIVIIPVEDNNVSVFDNRGEAVIAIGLTTLLLFTPSELEAVIYHELAHVYNKDTVHSLKLENKINKFNSMTKENSNFNFLLVFFFKPIQFYLNECVELYKHCSQLECELLADEMIIDFVDKQAFINATAKLQTYENVFDLPSEKNIFRNNIEAPKDFLNQIHEIYLQELNKNTEMLKAFIFNELTIRFPTHPTVRERMEKYNIKDFDLFTKSNNEKYILEVEKIISDYNNAWYEQNKIFYKNERNNEYAIYESKINENIDIESLSSLELGQLGYAYEIVGKIDDAVKLYKKALELDKDNSMASFRLGSYYIYCNDVNGVEYLINSMKLNKAYLEISIKIISMFYIRNNMEKERDEFRSFSVEMTQNTINRNSKKKRVKLIESNLDDNKLNVILGEINKYNVILEARLIAVSFEDNSYLYHIGIIFDEDFEQNDMQIAFAQLSNLLNNISTDDLKFNLVVINPLARDFLTKTILGPKSKEIYKKVI